MKKLNNNGVTLVELIVSFAIVGVAIIYFFQTLYTVRTIYKTAREETDSYINRNYDMRIIDAYYNTYGSVTYSRDEKYICDTYNLTCKTVEFDGYVYNNEITGGNSLLVGGEDGNNNAMQASNGYGKYYKLKVGYDTNGDNSVDKYYYLYRTYKKLDETGAASFREYFPGVSGKITGNSDGNFSSRRRVISASGTGTKANYVFSKEYLLETNQSKLIKFSMATDCDGATNKTTFTYNNNSIVLRYTGTNWNNSANFSFANVSNTNEQFWKCNSSCEGVSYETPDIARYHISKGNKSNLLAVVFREPGIPSRVTITVELEGNDLPNNCTAYTSLDSIGTGTIIR